MPLLSCLTFPIQEIVLSTLTIHHDKLTMSFAILLPKLWHEWTNSFPTALRVYNLQDERTVFVLLVEHDYIYAEKNLSDQSFKICGLGKQS